MDNSIFYLNELVKSLMTDIEAYQDALRMHAITIPREKLEEAVRYGFPEDIYSYYMNTYYVKNEAAAEGVINFINKDFIPYLQNVSFHLQEAMNVGPGGASAASVLTNPSSATKPQNPQSSRSVDDLAFRTHQLMKKAEAQEKNYRELEKALGIKRGPRMTVAEADKQNANPNHTYEYLPDSEGDYYYIDGKMRRSKWWVRFSPEKQSLLESMPRYRKNPDYKREYSINCATCAAAYALRLLGFDVKAKGNPEKNGNRNTWLSECHSFDIWNNVDGTKANPTHYEGWMKKKGLGEMTADDYKRFFEEECKETGVYIVTVAWKGGGGHATVLQRDVDGTLYYIEPQVFDASRTIDGRRSIDDLVNGMAPVQPSEKGVMRVDNKLFNVEYTDLFEI